MRTRNGDATKSVTPKKTTTERKSATKTTPDPVTESTTPKTAETKRGAAAKANQAKNNEASPLPIISSDSKPEQSTGMIELYSFRAFLCLDEMLLWLIEQLF